MDDISTAQKEGLEIGGLLVGSFPKASGITLRVEDYVPINRRATDGARFVLTPELRARMSSTRHRLIEKQTSVLGFFRSHLRSDPLSLSPEDRSFLNTEFRKAVHIAFLIRAGEPHLGAFFVPGSGGVIPSGPALDEFLLDPDEFDRFALQHRLGSGSVINETTAGFPTAVEESRPNGPQQRSSKGARRVLTWLGVSAAVSVFLLILWAPVTADFLFGPPQARLTVAKQEAGLLELRWTQRGPDLQKAKSGTLIVRDGNSERRIMLTRFELRQGSIAYQNRSDSVQFSLALHLSDSADLVQTVRWSAQ